MIIGETIFISGTILNPCFDVGLSSRLVPSACYPAPSMGDRGTKINIVDDENKILDTGPTGTVLTLCHPPPFSSFMKHHFPKAHVFHALT